MRSALPLLACAAALALPAQAAASPTVLYGLDDEAWLREGPGTLAARLDTLARLGADVVRVRVQWEEPRWRQDDAILGGLRARGIEPLVTLAGPDRWVRARPARAPTFGAFAGAAARRWPWVRRWSVWERAGRLGGAVYAERVFVPAAATIRRASPRALVAAEAAAGGAWLRAFRSRARADAYLAGSAAVAPGVPLWLTRDGPETGRRGVSEAVQARELSKAALRAYREKRVELLLHRPVRDARGRRTGLFTSDGDAKMAAHAFPYPLAQSGRRGASVLVWGQVRPREGRRHFRLQLIQGGETSWLGAVRTTSPRGYFTAVVAAPPGSLLRVWSVGDRLFSAPLLLA